MIIIDLLSSICNDSNASLSQIWIVNDLSPCFYKFFFGFLLHLLTLVIISYNLGRRLSCPYHLWTFPLALIRLSSFVLLGNLLIYDIYSYFFHTQTSTQWIDVIDGLLIFTSYSLMNILHFNRNLYHPERPRTLTSMMIVVFLVENYDFYRISIDRTTLIESVYISIRQLCFALITLALLVICQHRCQRAERNRTDETQRLLPEPNIRCLFRIFSSNNSIKEDNATIGQLFTFSWCSPMMKRGYQSLINDLNDLCSLPTVLFTSVSIDVDHRQLFRSMFKRFGTSFFLLGILKILADASAFGGPIFLNKLINYMQETSGIEQERNLRRGLFLSLTLISSVAFASILNTHFTYRINRLSLRCKMYLYTRIYSKATQLNASQMNCFNMGEIVNFMSTDSDRIVNFFQSFHAFWSLPVQIAVVLYLLYQQIGLTFLTGLAFAIVLIPINKCLASKIGQLSQEMMLHKDERVKLISEIIFGIRTIKMNTYENYFIDRMNNVRQKELRALRGRKYLDAFCVYFWATTPVLISVLTFTTYTLLGNELTPAKVFTSLALFALLISPLNAFPWVINGLVESRVSLKRVQRFIDIEPIPLRDFYENESNFSSFDIRLSQTSFSWKSSLNVESEDLVLKEIDLNIVRGNLVLILGRVGSGKTSLLNALLGELNKTEGSIDVDQVLENGFGYVGQEAWIQQMSLRENILFGKPFDEHWYRQVLDACALENDIKNLGVTGDQTLIGENGVTLSGQIVEKLLRTNELFVLSGGQKARLALARAVYQDKQIYLFDDPLSAVDVHVARHLFNQCFRHLLKDKTRLLCTHQIQYATQADYLILIDEGRIIRAGKPNEVLESTEFRRSMSNLSTETTAVATTQSSTTDLDEQIIQAENALQTEAEERCTGTVKFVVWKQYFIAVGICLSISIVVSIFLMQASRNIFDWWLSYWTSHQMSNVTIRPSLKILNPSVVTILDARPMFGFSARLDNGNFKEFFTIYIGLAVANSIFTLLRAFTFAYGGIAAARKLHRSLLKSLLKSSISFFDQTPSGRILNRFSSDTWSVDDSLPFIMNIFLANIFSLLGTLVLSCYGLPQFIFVLIPLTIFYYFIQNYYRWTSREIKRISSVCLSPVYAHFGETISGLSTIRAFRQVTRFINENYSLVSNSIRAQFASLIVGSWLSFRLQLIGIVMVAGISLIGIIEHVYTTRGSNPSLIGLSLSYILSVTGLLNGLISTFTETEKEMVGVERVTSYIDDLPAEDKNEEDLIFLNRDTSTGHGATIEYRNVIMRYNIDQKAALDQVNFFIKSNEKIGVVGRTGSGKSSLLATLFRTVNLTDGQILLDQIDTKTIDRHTLRQTLAIIPQDPFLFSGTIRDNLDPYVKYSDREIYDVLEKCDLRSLIESLGNGLDSIIVERGRNFSVGQKQLFCLARALLRKAKVLCLDEATANIDLETDRRIQQSIRSTCENVTVITIAHRVQTILDSDRVMVMDNGRLIEFDSPARLMENPQSTFARLVRRGQIQETR